MRRGRLLAEVVQRRREILAGRWRICSLAISPLRRLYKLSTVSFSIHTHYFTMCVQVQWWFAGNGKAAPTLFVGEIGGPPRTRPLIGQ